jgi:hypothetical protein
MGDIALRGNKLTRKRVKKSIGGLLKTIGKGISKRMTGSHKPKKGGWQDMDRPKAISEEKKPDWEFKADRAEKQKIDKQLNVAKNVGKGIAVAVPGSYAYGKWKKYKRDKEKKRTKKAIGGLLSKGFKVLKGPANKWRMEQAKNLKKHRLRTKIEKAREGRLQSKVKSNLDKKIASNPDLKKAVSQQRHPKSWRRHQQKGTK